MSIKLYNEEYLRENMLFLVTLIKGSIYFISSWSVSSFINHFQFCTRTSAYTQRVLYMYYYGILNSCVKKERKNINMPVNDLFLSYYV